MIIVRVECSEPGCEGRFETVVDQGDWDSSVFATGDDHAVGIEVQIDLPDGWSCVGGDILPDRGPFRATCGAHA